MLSPGPHPLSHGRRRVPAWFCVPPSGGKRWSPESPGIRCSSSLPLGGLTDLLILMTHIVQGAARGWGATVPHLALRPSASPQLTCSSHPLESTSPKDQSTFQKLLHINATTQLEHPEYAGPRLPASALVPRLSVLQRKVTPLEKELQDALKGLLGSRGSFMVPTQYGWILGEALPAFPPAGGRGCFTFCPLR